jgi:hypothetical protein
MTTPASPLLTLRILWFALMNSVAVSVVVTHFAATPGLVLDGPLATALPVVALVPGLTGLGLGALLRRTPYLTSCLLRWALAEATGMTGCVYLFLGGSSTVAFALAGLSIAMIAIQMPTAQALENAAGSSGS